ncbi:uncharacterized protein C8Q71DRAFT_863185 [Rhodofomes roseus]|uniref:Uncharacterized protein n=1 Tax=Rhodofomes roseus TaxID=34475 RepID=A0ABQ8JZ95_9APHY|nr:uncharacterized protein C8Q71DRAFT_863185 [Rhodofomes roseus]KAH9829610.1 hypothetical protein C8Q71DRAFT_863185 [Rhodofomes roseus]
MPSERPPGCAYCIVDPKRGIDELSVLAKIFYETLKNPRPDDNYNKMAIRAAEEFESAVDNTLFRQLKKDKKWEWETVEQRDERVQVRKSKVIVWMRNNRRYFRDLLAAAPRLLDLPAPSASKDTSERGASVRDLFMHDHRSIGSDATSEVRKAGGNRSAEATAFNEAYNVAIERMIAEEPEKYAEYQRRSAESKADAKRARQAAKAKAAASVEDSDDEVSREDVIEESRARLRYTARKSLDEWAKVTHTEIFMYVGWVDSDGEPVRYL